MPWDKTKPVGSEPLSEGDDRMRENFAWLETALPTSLVFPGNETTRGRPLMPRLTLAQRNALTPVDRMWIIRTDKPALEYYDAATTSWITYDFAFIGQVKQLSFNPSTAPEGWLLCDGSEVSRVTYEDLFDKIGTTFGSGDGSNTFNLPDLQGRVPVAMDSGDADFISPGTTGGEKEVTLDSDEIATHDHYDVPIGYGHGHDVTAYRSTGSLLGPLITDFKSATDNLEDTTRGDHTHTVDDSGQTRGNAHSNVQPYLTVAFMIFAGA